MTLLYRRGWFTDLFGIVIARGQYNINYLIADGIFGIQFRKRLQAIISVGSSSPFRKFGYVMGVDNLHVRSFGSVDVELFLLDGFINVVEVLLVVFFMPGH